jgi:hypothetical protein
MLKAFDVAKEQMPFATALALTKTGQAVKADLQAGMSSTFKTLRAYTRNSLTLRKATKTNLQATVAVRSRSVEAALGVEIVGGARNKAIEKVLSGVMPADKYAVPGPKAKIGSDGKVSISWLRTLVSQLGVTSKVSSGTTQRRRKQIAKGGLFMLTERDGKLPPGIYGRDGRHVLPYVFFVSQPNYGAKYDWVGIATNSANSHFPDELRKAAAQAMATAR